MICRFPVWSSWLDSPFSLGKPIHNPGNTPCGRQHQILREDKLVYTGNTLDVVINKRAFTQFFIQPFAFFLVIFSEHLKLNMILYGSFQLIKYAYFEL